MAWVVGIREVRYVEVRVEDSRTHGPRVLAPRMEVTNLPREAWARLMQFRVALPQHRGAGPCGSATSTMQSQAPRYVAPENFVGQRFTSADPMPVVPTPSPLQWSIRYLLAPLADYYATYEPPMRFGSQPAHRGKRAA